MGTDAGALELFLNCLGIEVGTHEDALQIFVPSCAADIRLHHSDDFAVAAEYAIGRPIRTIRHLYFCRQQIDERQCLNLNGG
jgi:hypothetical protein